MIIAGNFYPIVFSLHLHSSVHFAVIRSNSHPIGWDQTLLLTRHTAPFFIYSNFTLLVLSPTIFSITYPLCRQGEQTVVVFVQLVPHPCRSLCAGRAFSSARSDLLRFQTWLKQCLGAVLVTFVPVYMKVYPRCYFSMSWISVEASVPHFLSSSRFVFGFNLTHPYTLQHCWFIEWHARQ